MGSQVQCPNPECGQMTALGGDRLGRVFRCPRCGSRLPAASPAGPEPARQDWPARHRPLLSNRPAAEAESAATRVAVEDRPWSCDSWDQGPSNPVVPALGSGSGEPVAQLGRFRLRGMLGSGAFATVYLAYDPQLDREVAVKVLHEGVLAGSRAVERFRAEAKALARLRHPRIVPVYDVGQDGGRHYLAMAYIEGRTLAELIDEGPVEPRRAASIVAELADLLEHAHAQGVVHRDVKPANVLLDSAGEAHLTDFGLAHRLGSCERLTRVGAILGTPGYIAPEQARGDLESVGPAVDQYSLGIVLYELLCGRPPFQGPPTLVLYNALHEPPPQPREIRPGLPRDLETICLKALGKRPEDRYTSCRALAEDLRRWLRGEPIRARRAGSIERAVVWCRREPALVAATTLAVIGLVASTVLATTLARASGPTPDPSTASASAPERPGR